MANVITLKDGSEVEDTLDKEQIIKIINNQI